MNNYSIGTLYLWKLFKFLYIKRKAAKIAASLQLIIHFFYPSEGHMSLCGFQSLYTIGSPRRRTIETNPVLDPLKMD